MPHYRLYVLEKNGKLMGAGNFECADDHTAKERVNGLTERHDSELWRLVARFDSSIKPSSAVGLNRTRPARRKRLNA